MKFPLGETVITAGARAVLSDAEAAGLFRRHQSGDWGEVPLEDVQENELSLKEGYRLMSAYTVRGTKVWLITESTRECTTILLPNEY